MEPIVTHICIGIFKSIIYKKNILKLPTKLPLLCTMSGLMSPWTSQLLSGWRRTWTGHMEFAHMLSKSLGIAFLSHSAILKPRSNLFGMRSEEIRRSIYKFHLFLSIYKLFLSRETLIYIRKLVEGYICRKAIRRTEVQFPGFNASFNVLIVYLS